MNNKHAIIIIKNEDDKYLQYYDKEWESFLFPNCKLEDENDFDKIKEDIKNKYNILLDKIELKKDIIHSKYSEKHKMMREYHHYFYESSIKEENSEYKYFSYEDLINNKRIQEVNSDIVSFVKDIN